MAPSEKRVLVVEDNSRLRTALARALTSHGYAVEARATVASATQSLRTFRPEVVVVDVVLPDGDAFEIVEAARSAGLNVPAIAMSGRATPVQSFRLAQLGFFTYLPKPVDAESVVDAVERALSQPRDVESLVRRSVGLRPIHAMEHDVRDAMVDEALKRTGGNLQRAAGLLCVSRQLLQHILRKRSG